MYRPVPFGTEAKFTRSTAYEVAETKVTQVMDFARKHQHPLQCVMEKEEEEEGRRRKKCRNLIAPLRVQTVALFAPTKRSSITRCASKRIITKRALHRARHATQ